MGDLFAVTDGAVQAAPLLVVELSGPPRGKGRPRSRIVFPKAGKPFVHVYTDSETVEYERALAWKAKAAMKGRAPFEGPLAMRVFAMMPIAKSWPKRDRDAALAGTIFHMSTPDGDNIFKICADSLNKIAYDDDKQIVRHVVIKEYAERPGVILELYRLP